MARKYTAEEIERFEHARMRLKQFRQEVGLTVDEIVEKTCDLSASKKTSVKIVFGSAKLKPTNYNVQAIEAVIAAFRLNRNFVFGDDPMMFDDTEALTTEQWLRWNLNSDDAKQGVLNRFKMIMKGTGVTYREVGRLGGVRGSTVEMWFRRPPSNPKAFLPTMMLFCERYDVNANWLFFGSGEPKANLTYEQLKENLTRRLQGWWYVVNFTELVIEGGWVCVPEKFTIQKAHQATEVAKRYKPVCRKIDGKEITVYQTTRAISRHATKKNAERALEMELRRLKREGINAWDAWWSGVEIT